MNPEFRPAATPADLEAVAALLRVVVERLELEGQALWTGAEVALPALRSAHPGEFVLGVWDGVPVAAFILLEADPHYWPGDVPGEALYLHKLAVHPNHQGRGIGRAALDFARLRATALGKRSLKLDTAADRPALRALYEGYGFTLVGEGQVGRHRVAFYALGLP